MQRFVEAAPGVRLWAEELPGPGEPVLLVAGANTSALAWPTELLDLLATRHRVIRYDHRDTGASSHTVEDEPYSVEELAEDAVAVLDAFDVDRAHVLGLSLGGTVAQLLLLDHPDRLRSVTLCCAAPLGPAPDLPAPDPALLRMWGEVTDERSREQELDWRVEHWRLLHGTGTPFDDGWFRELEERVMAHSGREDAPAAHSLAGQDGPPRGAELAGVTVPTLVVEGPEDPLLPPPHAQHLAEAIGPAARLLRIDGLGHALSPAHALPLAQAVLDHTSRISA